MKDALTVIIPTFNEEKYIKQALFSSTFAEEVMVIDSFSTDRTVELVRQTECRLLQRKFDNFSQQKNFAISQATNDWILILDADEYLSYDLQKKIRSVLSTNSDKIAYYFPFKNYFINRFIQFGTNAHKEKIRLFNRKFCHYEGLVHEQLIFNGPTGSIPLPILHYTYKNLKHFIGKKNRYSTLQAEQIIEKNKTISSFHLVIKPLFRYLNELIFRLGILDGIPGLTSTAMNGYGVLSRYVKAQGMRGNLKTKTLQNYEEYTHDIMLEAKTKGMSRKKTETIYLSEFYLKPFLIFLKVYFLKKQFMNGLEGYITSYLAAFKQFNTILYHWLNKRDLD